MPYAQDCSGKQNKVEFVFPDFWPNPGPGRLPLDSSRGDVEFPGGFASVASVAVNFAPESIFVETCRKQKQHWSRRSSSFLLLLPSSFFLVLGGGRRNTKTIIPASTLISVGPHSEQNWEGNFEGSFSRKC